MYEMQKPIVLFALFLCAAVGAGAEEAIAIWHMGDRAVTNRVAVTDGRVVFTPEEAKGADRLEVIPDRARARKGENGFFVLPRGEFGTFRCESGEWLASNGGIVTLTDPPMPVYGMKTPRGTYLAQAFGWELWHGIEVRVVAGEYAVADVFDFRVEKPDCPFGIELTALPAAAGYPQMARVYRDRQFAKGAVRTIRARLKDQPALAEATTSVTVRIRQGWKPAPSPVLEQNDFNEPEMAVAVTFDRARQFVRALHAAGMRHGEFCLVGWNKGGHDGAYPQVWPVEPKLGGIDGLRAFIVEARSYGFNVTLHNNFQDCYTIADCYDEADMARDRFGVVQSNSGNRWIWSGGRSYLGCPQRMWERFVVKQMGEIAALGCRGLHYCDVLSNYRHDPCFDPRHPLTRKQAIRYYDQMLAEMRRTVGGSFSEGPHDFVAGTLDACLYVTGTPVVAPKPDCLVDRHVPFWQLVYHGSILSLPFGESMTYPAAKDAGARLRVVEFGGRPTIYIHRSFFGRKSIGSGTLTLVNDADFTQSVRDVAKAAAEYETRAALQFELMTDHILLAPGVALTVYGNGARTIVNYTDEPFRYGDSTAPAHDWILLH